MNIFFLLFLLNSVYSYNYFIHKYLGRNTIYNDMSLENMSIWADTIKRNSEYLWTRQLHYIDNVLECNENISVICKNNCIFTAILNFTNTLFMTKNIESIEFKLLLHLLQDFNQPLHLYGKFRGGNDLKFVLNKNNKNITINFHELFDSYLPIYFLEKYNYIPPNNSFEIFSMIEYQKYLKNKLYIMKIVCNIRFDKYIILEKYNTTIFKTLFDNYFDLIYTTFDFIRK